MLSYCVFLGETMKKIICLLLSALMIITAVPFTALANVQYYPGVTEEMCSASYWADKLESADNLILDSDEIAAYNKAGIKADGTKLFSVEDYPTTYNADNQSKKLQDAIIGEKPTRKLYIDGVEIDKDVYFEGLRQAVEDTAYTGGDRDVEYGICTKQGDVMGLPTSDVIGYNANDPDSEWQIAELKIGDPCIIKQKCEVNGEKFYYIVYDSLYGWINSDKIAVCESREEWLDAWKVNIGDKNFLVVTCDKIVTEKSLKVPTTSEVKLTMGSVLKLVPENEIPDSIGERNSWNNYTVYLPVRDSEGKYVKQPALISQHCDVSLGFLKFTERNIAKVALSCLGNRYGWAGMLDAMDCSLYTRDVYRCFGFSIPRNTTWQQLVPNTKFDVSTLSDEEKQAFLDKMPLGALLYMKGHTMLYLGSDNGTGYAISDLGSAVLPDAEPDETGQYPIVSTYSVTIVPLTARRKDGTKWIGNIHTVILPQEYDGHKYVETVIPPNCKDKGYTLHTCRFCNDSFTDTETDIISEHQYDGGKLTKQPTFKKQGKKTYTCTICGAEKTEPVSKLGSAKLSKVKKGKKRFTAVWKPVADVDGYQIKYSRKKNMKKAKKKTVKGANKKSLTVRKLKSGKTYYVRIRAYKKIGDKTIYSKWSAKKKIKVK